MAETDAEVTVPAPRPRWLEWIVGHEMRDALVTAILPYEKDNPQESRRREAAERHVQVFLDALVENLGDSPPATATTATTLHPLVETLACQLFVARHGHTGLSWDDVDHYDWEQQARRVLEGWWDLKNPVVVLNLRDDSLALGRVWGSDCERCGNATPGSMRCDSCGRDDRTRPLYIAGGDA